MNIDYFIKSAAPMRVGSADHEALVKLRNDGKIDQKTFDHHFNSGTLPTPTTPTKPTAYTDLANLNLYTFGGQEPDLGIKVPEVKLDPFPETSISSPDILGNTVADGVTDLRQFDISKGLNNIPSVAVNGDGTLTISQQNPITDPIPIKIPQNAVNDATQYDIYNSLTGVNTGNNGFSINQLLPEGHRVSGEATLSDEAVQNIKKQIAADKAKVPAKAVADGTEDVTSQIQKYKADADAIQRAKEEAAKAAQQAAAATTPAQTTNSSDTLQKYLLWGGLGAGALGLAGYLAGRNNNKKKKQRRPYAMPLMQQQPMMQGQYPHQGAMQGRYPTY